jgi:hypothetical protein
MSISAMPLENGIKISLMTVSINAEHGETALHVATLCDPILTLRRIAVR